MQPVYQGHSLQRQSLGPCRHSRPPRSKGPLLSGSWPNASPGAFDSMHQDKSFSRRSGSGAASCFRGHGFKSCAGLLSIRPLLTSGVGNGPGILPSLSFLCLNNGPAGKGNSRLSFVPLPNVRLVPRARLALYPPARHLAPFPSSAAYGGKKKTDLHFLFRLMIYATAEITVLQQSTVV